MNPGSPIRALAILSDPEAQVSLEQIFRTSNWKLRCVNGLDRARTLIDELAAGVVISSDRLPDGHWHDLLGELQAARSEPLLIVASGLPDDDLWAEVWRRGGFDVLAIPFQQREVALSVTLAWQYWRKGQRRVLRRPERL